MRRTTRLSLAAVTAVLATAVAGASPAVATGCPLISDRAGDADLLGQRDLDGPPELDLLSGDLASGPTTVVGVLRVASLAPDVRTTAGTRWILRWEIGSTIYVLEARRDQAGVYSGALRADNGGIVTVTPLPLSVDAVNATFAWVAPRGAVPHLATPGAAFEQIGAASYLALVRDGTMSVDAAEAGFGTVYVDQSPGCVAAS